MKKLILSLLLLVVATVPAMADSPLTSTVWWKHYAKNKVIVEASESGCTERVMNLICDEKSPLDLRLAAVNALGWAFEGQNNYERCLDHYLKKHPLAMEDEENPSSAETICVFAYLMALDNYFEVDNALGMATRAEEMKPSSKGIALIKALISAQIIMNDNWCEVYKVVARVAYDRKLDKDVSDSMVEEIMDYIKLYLDSCH